MTTDEYARARAQRRRRFQQRQTVIFGTIILALAVLLTIAWLTWSRVIPSPFAREFSADPTSTLSDQIACPPVETVTVPFSEITASVYNSTSTAGLASNVSDTLAGVGVTITESGNWDTQIAGVGRIQTGAAGVEEAYTIAQVLPGMLVTLDARTDSSITILIGTAFTAPVDPTTVAVGVPVILPPECSELPAPEEGATLPAPVEGEPAPVDGVPAPGEGEPPAGQPTIDPETGEVLPVEPPATG